VRCCADPQGPGAARLLASEPALGPHLPAAWLVGPARLAKAGVGEPRLGALGCAPAARQPSVTLCQRPWPFTLPPLPWGILSRFGAGEVAGSDSAHTHLTRVLVRTEAEIKGPRGSTPQSWNLGLEASVAFF